MYTRPNPRISSLLTYVGHAAISWQGFCFIKYEDQRSTILAVDNFNGIELLGRTIRVDHKHKYSLPAEVRREGVAKFRIRSQSPTHAQERLGAQSKQTNFLNFQLQSTLLTR